MRQRADVFLASVLVLFLELACIRWFPAHVLFLTFFTNVMLLAAFLGISVGSLAASRRHNYLTWTPLLLVLSIGTAHLIEWERWSTGSAIRVGSAASPQLVFFGVESQPGDPSQFVVPIEAVSGVLFVLVALTLVGPGQQLGRSLARFSNRVEAYALNIAGSIAGILLFTACSWLELGPIWWFGGTLAAIGYFQIGRLGPFAAREPGAPRVPQTVSMTIFVLGGAAALLLVAFPTRFAGAAMPSDLPDARPRELWSPYYRIQYNEAARFITVNLIGHQQMSSRKTSFPAYALPHLFNRDAGQPPFAQALVIGAGSGNDVSRALQWGATRVDAVEIDPVILRLGQRDHPDHPYADGRTFAHLDDGRNYLRSTNKQYDLIVYALVDSLVLHSSYSNIRLESYLFTTQAFDDIRKRLRPGGVFVMYNYFRQGWIVNRLQGMLEQTFGADNPIVFNLPTRARVGPDDVLKGDFTMMLAGNTAPIKAAFERHREYWLRNDRGSGAQTPNGFDMSNAGLRAEWSEGTDGADERGWMRFRPTTVVKPADALRLASDAWPFLYLRSPMIPALSLRGIAVMSALGALLLVPFLRGRSTPGAPAAGLHFLAHMFFLGAGFMLIETKAVVQMALLFGSTWMVNSIVFCAVLTMALAANLYVLVVRPVSLTPYYAGLAVSLAASAVIPIDAFLGLSRDVQIAASCTLAFAPVLFAGVVFGTSFAHAPDADRAFGANTAGAMAGGLSEYTSMLLGFQYVVVVAMAFYACSAISVRARRPGAQRS